MTVKLRLLLLFLSIAAINARISGQSNPPTFGVKAGLNLSNFSEDLDFPPLNFVPDRNYHLGLFGTLPIMPSLSIQLEALVNQRGAQQDYDSDFEYQVRLAYLDLPLLLLYRKGNFLIEAGPVFGFKLNTTVETDANPAIPLTEELWNSGFDYASAMGLGYAVERFRFGIRYLHGLTPQIKDLVLTDGNGEPLGDGGYYRHRTWQLSMGYQLF